MRIALVSLCVIAAGAMSVCLVGCSPDPTQTPTNNAGGEAERGNGGSAVQEHPTEGPHGGHLIELGSEEYHAELLHDENTHTVTIHLLDGAAKQPVAVALPEVTVQLHQDGQFVKYALKAVQGEGDAAGAASQFEIVDAALCDALCHEDEVRGRLQLTIQGKPYTGVIEHSSHDEDGHEGHDH